MSSVNKVILIGNLGADPEVRYTQGGTSVCSLRIATTETWTDKDGQKQEKTEWHRVTVWGRDAENCGQYLAKGRLVYVEGRIETRKYQDKDGSDRYVTEIVAQTVRFLGGGGGEERQEGGRTQNSGGGGAYGPRDRGGAQRSAPPAGPPGPGFNDDDLPF